MTRDRFVAITFELIKKVDELATAIQYAARASVGSPLVKPYVEDLRSKHSRAWSDLNQHLMLVPNEWEA